MNVHICILFLLVLLLNNLAGWVKNLDLEFLGLLDDFLLELLADLVRDHSAVCCVLVDEHIEILKGTNDDWDET